MLMNFKDGHPSNTKEAYLCKRRIKNGKNTWFEVSYYDQKRKKYFRTHTKNFKFSKYFEAVPWDKIRET